MNPLGIVETTSSPISFSSLKGVKVALVHDWLTGLRGGEKCLEVLCEAFPDATLHTLIHRVGSTSPAIERMRIATSPLQHIPGIFRSYRNFLPAMPLAARSWKPRGVDLVVSLSHCVAKAVRAPRGVPHVCYCFTPMRYAWDGRAAYLESWKDRPVRKFLAGTVLDGLRRWDRAAAHRVTHFAAISETIRERIFRCYGRSGIVIPPPVATDYYTRDPRVQREEYDLCVSALVAYKKIDHAVSACLAMNRALIIIGEGPERSRLEGLANGSPLIRFLGWQPNEVIRDHYRRCRCLIFPGEEDFGIVPVEALACGAPVVALARGGASETIEGVGRLYLEPSVEALQNALNAWEGSGKPHDSMLARRRAECYATNLFRDRLLAFLAHVVTSPVDRVPPAPHVSLINASSVD